MAGGTDSDINDKDDGGEVRQRYTKSIDRDISRAIPNFKWNNCANISTPLGRKRCQG